MPSRKYSNLLEQNELFWRGFKVDHGIYNHESESLTSHSRILLESVFHVYPLSNITGKNGQHSDRYADASGAGKDVYEFVSFTYLWVAMVNQQNFLTTIYLPL